MKLITQAQFNTSHSAILKILEYHNWSAAKRTLFYRSKQDETSSQCTIHKGIMKDSNYRAFLSLERLFLKWLHRAQVSCSYPLKMNSTEHGKHANYFQANNKFKIGDISEEEKKACLLSKKELIKNNNYSFRRHTGLRLWAKCLTQHALCKQ